MNGPFVINSPLNSVIAGVRASAPLYRSLRTRRNHDDLWRLRDGLLRDDDRFRSETAALTAEGKQGDDACDSDDKADDETRDSAAVDRTAFIFACSDANIRVIRCVIVSNASVSNASLRRPWITAVSQVTFVRIKCHLRGSTFQSTIAG